MLPRVCAFLSAALILFASTGCASKAQAKTPTERPPLDAPPPPPRIIAPAPVETTAEAPVTGAPVKPMPSRPAASPPAGTSAPRPETAKPAPERAEPPRSEPSGGLLQTTPPGNEAEAEKNIRALLAMVDQTLNRVDYRTLKADGRTQYNTSKRFMQQAQDALKAKNFAFAQTLADKAAELARSLPSK